MRSKKHLSYKDSGVDITKGNLFVREIASMVKPTKSKQVLRDIGSFGGLFAFDQNKYKEPVLVSSTDGVGTKLIIAQNLGIHQWVGFDLVGMCVNDVATTGAVPLFFLDYISTGRIRLSILKNVIKGIASACKEAGYALIGGETAEMPDMYKPGQYDLAGFCVGIIDKKDIIDGSGIKKGDIIIGLASSGPHSNGYSLIRKVFSKSELIRFKNRILKPTRLYTKPLLGLQKKVKVKGIAHITGGAYFEKIPRIIPKGLSAVIDTRSWRVPNIFKQIKARGNIRTREMYRVFNMGIGMIVVLPAKDLKKARAILTGYKIKSRVIGEVEKGDEKVKLL
jgi:phosphoribosylformylglycinamidine cyclo-ligase